MEIFGQGERLKLAVLKLAGSNLTELEELMLVTEEDFRDTLASAESPNIMKSGADGAAKLEAQREKLRKMDRDQYEKWLCEHVPPHLL